MESTRPPTDAADTTPPAGASTEATAAAPTGVEADVPDPGPKTAPCLAADASSDAHTFDWSQFGVRSAKVRALQKKADIPTAVKPAMKGSDGVGTKRKPQQRQKVAASKRRKKKSSATRSTQSKLKKKTSRTKRKRRQKSTKGGHADAGTGADKKEDEDEELFCVCRKPYDGEWMVACDFCPGWFHPRCVGLTRENAEAMPHYECEACATKRRLSAVRERHSATTSSFMRSSGKRSSSAKGRKQGKHITTPSPLQMYV
jgi:PHD-finger